MLGTHGPKNLVFILYFVYLVAYPMYCYILMEAEGRDFLYKIINTHSMSEQLFIAMQWLHISLTYKKTNSLFYSFLFQSVVQFYTLPNPDGGILFITSKNRWSTSVMMTRGSE